MPDKTEAPDPIEQNRARWDEVVDIHVASDFYRVAEFKAGQSKLDPIVLVLESGRAERSAEEYLGGHAKSDAAFLKGVHQQILRRTARASGDFAWVASESELHTQVDGKAVTMLSTETMLLQRRPTDWKIVHIHWSSRTKNPAAAH